MLDVYHRLHGADSDFFVPEDFEVSVRNLRWILSQAKRWTGFHGGVRKVAVTSYVTKDHLDPNFEARTIHVAIYTQELNGTRSLYRQFLRRADGTLIELFDDMALPDADDVKNLESLLSQARTR